MIAPALVAPRGGRPRPQSPPSTSAAGSPRSRPLSPTGSGGPLGLLDRVVPTALLLGSPSLLATTLLMLVVPTPLTLLLATTLLALRQWPSCSPHTSGTRGDCCYVRTEVRDVMDELSEIQIDPGLCPRCGAPVPRRRTGRPATWCSQSRRRSAYEERRAAARGAIALRVVDRV